MDILYALGRATGQEVRERLPDNLGYSGVRTILRILERKGHVRHEQEGLHYVYLPASDPRQARKSAMRRLVDTFFQGSVKAAAAALIDPSSSRLSKEDLEELEEMIRRARKEKNP